MKHTEWTLLVTHMPCGLLCNQPWCARGSLRFCSGMLVDVSRGIGGRVFYHACRKLVRGNPRVAAIKSITRLGTGRD